MQHAEQSDEVAISKAEFARRRNVSRARVSQWINEKKINGVALAGEGSRARIVESIAVAQLRNALDPNQIAGNGLATRLTVGVAAEVWSTATPSTESNDLEARVKRARVDLIERTNRRAAEEEAARAGTLIATDQIAMQMGRLTSQLVALFEGSLTELAAALSAQFKIPQRDALHLLRGEFRRVRTAAAATFRYRAEDIPRLVEFDVDAGPATFDAGEPRRE